MKFYTFNQNNSGGYFIENDHVACHLIIEARGLWEAIDKMLDITEDYSEFCPCCGPRWWGSANEYARPMIYDTDAYKYRGGILGDSIIIYYADGRVEKLGYEEDE